jgi:hypothetical protein
MGVSLKTYSRTDFSSICLKQEGKRMQFFPHALTALRLAMAHLAHSGVKSESEFDIFGNAKIAMLYSIRKALAKDEDAAGRGVGNLGQPTSPNGSTPWWEPASILYLIMQKINCDQLIKQSHERSQLDAFPLDVCVTSNEHCLILAAF